MQPELVYWAPAEVVESDRPQKVWLEAAISISPFSVNGLICLLPFEPA